MFVNSPQHKQLKEKVSLFMEAGRFDAAEKFVRSAMTSDSHHAFHHHILGLIFHRQSRFAEAIQEFKAALHLEPAFAEAALNLATTFCDLGQYEEAGHVVEALKKTAEARQGTPRYLQSQIAALHFATGQAYENLGYFAEAIQEYRRAVGQDPQFAAVKLSLAKLYHASGESEHAQKELEDILRNEETNVEARNLLGRLFFERGNTRAAKDHWLKCLQFHPSDQTSKAFLQLCQSLQNPNP